MTSLAAAVDAKDESSDADLAADDDNEDQRERKRLVAKRDALANRAVVLEAGRFELSFDYESVRCLKQCLSL